MATAPLETVVRHLHEVVGFEPLGQLTDAELLQRFLDRRDEAAFAALLKRHGGMVFNVCRRVLPHVHDTEDAFQATFLALVREGTAISRRGSTGPWLFRVATRIARKARARLVRQAVQSLDGVEPAAADGSREVLRRDLCGVLDEEVGRLPAKYQRPVVLCYLEGKTNEQAAAELGCPKGTVATRLAWARERLRSRLARRGVSLAAALVLLREEQAASAAAVASLAARAARGGLASSAGGAVSTTATALAEGVVRGLRLSKLGRVLTVLLALGVAVGGTGWLIQHTFGVRTPAAEEADEPKQAAGEKEAAKRAGEPSIQGVVVDPFGKPAAGVTVWLLKTTYSPVETRSAAELRTDDQGRFSLPASTLSKESHHSLLARDAAGRMGWLSYLRPESAGKETIKIKVHESGDVAGRLVNAAGKPLARAKVVPRSVGTGSLRERRYDAIALPADLAAKHAAETGADGSFTLPNLPASGSLYARITVSDFGTFSVGWDTDSSVTIRLDRPGSIRGKLTGLTDAKVLAKAKLSLRQEDDQKADRVASFQIVHHEEKEPAQDGGFEFTGIPPGKYRVSLVPEQQATYFADPSPVLEVRPGATVSDLTLRIQPTLTVRGRVVDAVSGAGIKGLAFWVHHFRENTLLPAAHVTTDADGRYSANVKPGKITVDLSRAPQGYLEPPLDTAHPRIDADKDIEYPTIKLQRCARVEGIVVDDVGKPVAGARVHVVVPARPIFWEGGKTPGVVTDRDGKFVLSELQPKDKVPLAASTDKATTAASVFVLPAEQKEPLRLVVSPDNVFRLRGTVVDQSGQPIRSASVRVVWDRDFVSGQTVSYSGTGKVLETCATDAPGRFQSKPLWAGDNYHVEVTAEGYAKVVTPGLTGARGRSGDYGPIQLARVGQAVRGKVIDHAGRPVAGVRVFNTADGPQPVRTTTDERGRFLLNDLNAGPVYVFAQKAGYRFTGVRVEAGSDVTIRLLPPVEAPPEPRPAAKGPTFDHERELARGFLERLWALPPAERAPLESELLKGMARLDPDQALTWSREVGGRYEWHTRGVIATHLARTDAQKSLDILAPLPDPNYHLQKLAERYAATDPAKALLFAEAAATAARKLKNDDRIGALAEAGSALARLGKSEAGRKLIDEAADAAELLAPGQQTAFARGRAAKAVAPHDLARARRLLRPITKEEGRERYEAWVAVAARDPSLASTDWYKAKAGVQVAYHLAATKPGEAVRMAENIAEVKARAEAFAWIAVVIAPKDKKQAWALIDRALDLCLNEADGFRSWSNYGRESAFAAWVAVQAAKADYPDMESVVQRVLATRPSPRYETTAWVVESQVATAMILALVDRQTAKELLQTLEPRSHLIGTGYSSIRKPQWYKAWSLADPDYAATLFEKEFAARPFPNDRESAILGLVELLPVPPADRAEHLLRRSWSFWYPGEE